MKVTRYILILIGLIYSINAYADIYISLTAKLIRPSCIITSENGEKEFFINFKEVSLDRLTEEKKSFGILIKECDLKKNLKIYLSPQEGSEIIINNESVLATSIEGLGIRFTEENKSNALNLYQWERITPSVSGNTGKIIIQSQLVTEQSIETLAAGPFTAAISVMIDYL